MNKTLSIVIILLTTLSASSQYVYKIKADSVKITNDSCNAELILENSTRHVNGFLYNKGNGRTEFRRGAIKYNDSLYIIGGDTLNIQSGTPSGSAWLVNGNTGTDPATNFIGTLDYNAIAFRVNNLEQMRLTPAGVLAVGGDGATVINTATSWSSLAAGADQTMNGSKSIALGWANSVQNHNQYHIGVSNTASEEYCWTWGNNLTNTASFTYSIGNNFTNDLANTIMLGVGSPLLTINSNGAGIGTTDPQAQLHTTGTVRFANFPNDVAESQFLTTDVNGNVKLKSLDAVVAANAWGLGGNAGTNPATNFIGTTDAQPVIFKMNNTETMRINTDRSTYFNAGNINISSVFSNDYYYGNWVRINNNSPNPGTGSGVRFSINDTIRTQIFHNTGAFSLGGSFDVLTGNAEILSRTGDVYLSTNTFRAHGLIVKNTTGNVGIGNIIPSEKLDVTGNVRFSGALMPNNLAGTAGQVLTSAGAGAPPTWTSSGSLGWGLTGNTGTNPASNFIGTADDNDAVFKRNGVTVFSLKKYDAARPAVLSFPLTNTIFNSPQMTTGNAVEFQAGTYNGFPLFELVVDSSSFNGMTVNLFGTRDHLFQFTPFNNRRAGAFAVIENYGYDGLRLGSTAHLTDQPRPIYFDIGRTEKMKLDSLGRLGIGTPSPQYKLDVNGDAHINTSLTYGSTFGATLDVTGTHARLLANSSTDAITISTEKNPSSIRLQVNNGNRGVTMDGTTNNFLFMGGSGETLSGIGNVNGTGNLALLYSTAANSQTEGARLSTTGNFGIATTSPQYKLDVNGDARVSTVPFLASRDTVLTYDPSSKQIKATKLPAAPAKVVNTSDQTSTSTTVANSNTLSFSVVSGTYYRFRFTVVFRTAATTTGIKFTLTHPGATVFSANATIPVAADGTASQFIGWITSSGDVVTSTGVQAANTDYVAIVEGMILPSASGTLQLQFGSEVGGSTVTLRNGSLAFLELY